MWYLKENIHGAYPELYRARSWTCVRDRSDVYEPEGWMNVLKDRIEAHKAQNSMFPLSHES